MSTVATRRPAPGSGEVRTAELSIGGMTCASCAARIERRLSRLGDVAATVNFATQTARVRFPAAVDAADLIAAIEQAGYTATLSAAADGTQAAAEEERAGAEMARLRRRLLVSLALAVPVVAAGHGPGVAVPQLAVGQPGARLAGRALGSLAVPPRRRAGRPARRGDDGHADLGRGRVRVPVVAVRAAFRRLAGARRAARRDVPGGCGGGDGAGSARPLPRGPGEAALGGGAARAAVAGGQGRRRAARRTARSACRWRSSPWGRSSWSGRGRRSPPTGLSFAAVRRWTPRC